MNPFTRRLLFLLFFLSGFCSLVYQVVWTRLAFAAFGIITPVLSVVLSVFMLGLAVGSWAGGRNIASLVRKTGLSAAAFYAGAEFIIGLGAFAVPEIVRDGRVFFAGERARPIRSATFPCRRWFWRVPFCRGVCSWGRPFR